MEDDIVMVLEEAELNMGASIEHLEKVLLGIRAGKANPVMLQGVKVEYYGAMTPLNQVASVIAEDGRTLRVQPFDRSALAAIERAIINSNLGFNPQNDGTLIRINVPMLTEERRRSLVKQAREEGEKARISIRSHRKEAYDELKKLKDVGISEDQIKRGEEAVEKLTKGFGDKVEEVLKKKEGEIMTI